MLGFSKHHTSKVKIFCGDQENVGVTNTRSLNMLKYYINAPSKFEEVDEFKRRNFYEDTIHIAKCSDAVLFSKRYNGARSVKVMIEEEEQVITILTDHITIVDDQKEFERR
jgi:hypothetical protein